MRGSAFLDQMGLIDPAYVEAAEHACGKKRNLWVRLGTAAAALCLVVGGIAAAGDGLWKAPETVENLGSVDNFVQETMAYGFYLDGDRSVCYYPISFEERKQYGLVPEDAMGLDGENFDRITEADLGEPLGRVTGCEKAELNGRTVYRFARAAGQDSICILEAPDGYAFYVGHLRVETELGSDFAWVLEIYGLPESLDRLEISASGLPGSGNTLTQADQKAVLAILAGNRNSGLEANERRFAKAWYEAYGNEDVYYDEEIGVCVFREAAEGSPAEKGTVYDRARALWDKGERLIQITTKKGYRLLVDYFPSIRTFICVDGFYELSTEDAEALNGLLGIPD